MDNVLFEKENIYEYQIWGGIRNFLYYTMEVAIKWDEITDDNDNGHGTQFHRAWLDSANIFTVKQ